MSDIPPGAFTPKGQKAIREWIFRILDDLPTVGPVGFGIDTNGNSIEVAEYRDGAADVEIGTFDEGWLCQPATSEECPECPGEQPTLVFAHQSNECILQDCLGCRTRTLLVDGGDD